MTRTRSEPRAEIALLFAWNFAAVTAFFVGRAVRDALFLAHESADRLPYMYIASPVVVTLVGLLYGKVAPRFSRERLVVATPLVFATLIIAARLWLGPSWLYYALYVVVECLGALAMMQFWLTAGERFSPRDAKRWFGVVAAGGTAANIAIGFVLRAVVGRTGVEDMLWLVAGALVAVAVLAFFVGRRPSIGSRVVAKPRANPKGEKAEPVAGTSHLRLLAPMIACTMLAVTLLDFQFKAITTEHYASDRVAMVEFFGTLSIVTGAASLVVQLTLTGRILGRFGIVGALLLLPSTMALGAAALLLVPSLVAATVSKFGDQTLRYTVHDAGMQLLYMPVPRAVRSKKKAFLDTVVRPASEASVGLVLLAYRAFSVTLWPLAVAALVVSLVWVALVVRLRKAYAGAIAETLRRRRVVALEPDDVLVVSPSAAVPRLATREAAAAVRSALASGDRAVVLHGLELATMARLVEAGALTSAELTPWLTHEDIEVRAAALRALYRTGDPADRARVVDQVGRLLASADPSELRAGLVAVAELGDAAWTEAVLAHLGARRLRRLVVAALGAIGANEAVSGPMIAALLERISDRDEAVRDVACAALWAAARGGARLDAAEVERVVRVVKHELEQVFTAMAAAEGLGRRESTLVADGTRRLVPFLPDSSEGPAALVSRALRERSEHATARALDLVGALDVGLSLDIARANLREPEAVRRANAVELLEAQRWSAPVAPLRSLILAAIDESPRDRKLAIAERNLELPRHTRDGWALVLLADTDPWIVACAAYVAGATGIVAVRERLVELTSAHDKLVAETARTALIRLDRKTEAGMLMTADKVLFLKGLELFAQVPGAALVEVVVATDEVELEDGERLFAEGDPGDALFLIVEGRIAVMRGGAVVAELGAREVIGEMALLDSSPRSADAVAQGPVRLLRLGRDDFINLLTERPEVATGVIRVLTRRLRAASEKAAVAAQGR